MAKAAWCTVTPTSGKENGTINISAAAHAGRDARSTTVTVTATNGTKPSQNVTVTQAGVGVKLTLDTTKPDVPGTGGTVVVNGTSNSKTLTVLGVLATFGVTGKIKIGSAAEIALKLAGVADTITVAGDPGAAGIYNFTVTLILPASPMPTAILPYIDVTDSAGTKIRCQFKWLAGASRISVDKPNLSLINAGTAQTVAITSNDEWTVS